MSFNPAGYNIIEERDGVWIVQVIDEIAYFGTFTEVVVYAIIKLGFNPDDIEEAVQTMVEEGHNAAHFGMNRTFLFSFVKTYVEDRLAS